MFKFKSTIPDLQRDKAIFIMTPHRKNQSQSVILFICMLIFVCMLPFKAVIGGEKGGLHFKSLQKRLIKDGFDSHTITELYNHPKVYFEKKGITLFLTHREAKLNYDQFVSSGMIKKARRYMKTHESVLSKIEKNYGVDKEVITSIILVETQLGAILGGPFILNTLSTMAALADPVVRERFWEELSHSKQVTRKKYEEWVKRKSNWAYKELKTFLEYTSSESMDPVDIKGSYAGAMGIAQFMPSSISAFAKDGNDDGRIDLFNHSDAIASVANYLRHYGWFPGIDRKKAYKVVLRYNYSSPYAKTVLKISTLLKG